MKCQKEKKVLILNLLFFLNFSMNVFSKTHFGMRRLCTFRELKFHLLSSDPKFFISVRHGVVDNSFVKISHYLVSGLFFFLYNSEKASTNHPYIRPYVVYANTSSTSKNNCSSSDNNR